MAMPVDDDTSLQQNLVDQEQRYLNLIESTEQHLKILSEQASRLKAENIDQAALLTQLRHANENLERDYKCMQEECNCLKDQNSALMKMISIHESENIEFNSKVSELTKDNFELKNQILKLEDTCRAESKHLSSAGEKNELLLQQLYQVQEELENYFLECLSKDAQLIQKDEKIAWLRERRTSLRKILQSQRTLAIRFYTTHSRLAATHESKQVPIYSRKKDA